MVSSLLTRIRFVSIFIVIWLQWQNAQAKTRWQPSIIWDGFNKLLTCKCNWMNIPKLDTFDRVELICPKQQLVSAFRDHDISKAKVFYNIFMRKFNKTNNSLDELRTLLNNDSFCDPEHNETEKLYTCVKYDESNPTNGYGFSYKLRIHSDANLNEGDIAVIFSNTKTGDEADLKNTKPNCAMVFVINVTASAGMKYDLSYDKCFTPKSYCDISRRCSCRGDPELTSTTPSKPESTVTTRETGSTVATRKTTALESTDTTGGTDNISTTTTTAPRENRNSTGNETIPPNYSGRSQSNDAFQLYSFFVGLAVGAAICILAVFIVIVIKKKKKGKKKDEDVNRNQQKKISDSTFATVVQFNSPNGKATVMENGYETPTDQKQSQDNAVTGFNNQAFEPVTPTAPPFVDPNDGDGHVLPNYPRASNDRLPSVETSERVKALPPLNNKPRLPSIASK